MLEEYASARQKAIGRSNRHKSSEKCFQDCTWIWSKVMHLGNFSML